MKTLINSVLKSSLVATIFVASMVSLNASAATAATNKTVSIEKETANKDIKKVVVTGNVNVLIIQNANESVKVDELDLDKVSLKQMGNTLTISSSENTPVTVTVYVKDIYRIDASGKTTVKTVGSFNVKNLQVILNDNAKARVKGHTESLYTIVNDNANLQLIGTSDNHISDMASFAKINVNKFAAAKTEGLNTLVTTITPEDLLVTVLSK